MREQNMVKLLTVLMLIALAQCSPNNESTNVRQPQDIQASELIGNWTTTHVSMSRCIANGDTLAPDTLKVQSNYWIAQGNIITHVNQITRSPCNVRPYPAPSIDPIVIGQWKIRHDTLFVYPVSDSTGKLQDTAYFALTKLTSGKIVFSSKIALDTCADDGANPPVIETHVPR
jgi:hypothetical protein